MWRPVIGNHLMQGTRYAKVIFIDSWCGQEQPAASQKPQEQDRESSPYFHSVLQLPQDFLKSNQSQIMIFSSNLKLVNFIFCISYNSPQSAHLATEKDKTLLKRNTLVSWLPRVSLTWEEAIDFRKK